MTLKANGIKSERAEREYNIASIEKHMIKYYASTLKRIFSDSEQLISKKLHRTIARPGHLKISKAGTPPQKILIVSELFV